MPLPPGLQINPATGELTGIPSTTGTFAFSLKVRDVTGLSRTVEQEVTILPYVEMEHGDEVPFALMSVGKAYSDGVPVVNGVAPRLFSIAAGTLPDGLSLNASTGIISGTPTTEGAFAFTYRCTDAKQQTIDLVVSGFVLNPPTITGAFAPTDAVVGVAYESSGYAVEDGHLPITWSVSAGALPAGLTLDPETGIVSGTGTDNGGFDFTLRATDARGDFDEIAVSMLVYLKPSLSGTPGPAMATRVYGGFTPNRSSGKGPFTYTKVAGTLPAGLSLNASTGAVTGTPTTAAAYAFTLRVTDALGSTGDLACSLTVDSNLTLTGSAAPAATKDAPFAYNPVRGGGVGPYTFSLHAGTLPDGLSFSTSSGMISGAPTLQESEAITIRVTDGHGRTADLSLTITVAGDLALSGTLDLYATNGVAYSDSFALAGGSAPFVYSIVAGALPSGLTINAGTGVISGTPDSATAQATRAFTVRVTDATTAYTERAGTIKHAAAPAMSGNLDDASVGVAYSDGFFANYGHPPLAWTLDSGAVPTGTTLNASTGIISGTPTTPQTVTPVCRVTDAAGNTATRSEAMTVYAQPALSGTITDEASAATSAGTDGTAYSDGLSVSGGKTPLTWSVTGSLPPGLSINASTGVISGTTGYVSGSAAYTDYAFTIKVVDALGRQDTQAASIRLYRHVTAPSTAYAAGTDNVAYAQTIAAQYGKAAIAYSKSSGTLPTGLALNAATGALTGTPTTPGSYNFTVLMTDALGKTASKAHAVTIHSEAAISGTPAAATKTVAYSHTFTKSGGDGTYAFSLVAGSLPAGLSLGASTGKITGTPTGTGTSNFTVRVTSAGSTDDIATSIEVKAFPTLALNYDRGTSGEAYSDTVTAAGGHTPYVFSKSAGTLPAGLSLNASTGALTGTPSISNAISTLTYNFTIRLTDAKGNIVDTEGSVTIARALSVVGDFPAGTEGIAYNSTLYGTGGWTPRTWSIVAGALPTGLSLNASTGAVAGTPTVDGTYNFTIRMTDGDSHTESVAKSIVIAAGGPALSVSASPSPASDYAVVRANGGFCDANITATAAGGAGGYSYAWTRIASNGFTYANANTATLSVSYRSYVADSLQETWRCTVTDGDGATASVDVNVYFTYDESEF